MSEHDPLPISLFDYDLPEELIAQEPLRDRAASRLLVLDRESGETTHTCFRHIGEWLVPGDLLVINDTRVLPARLLARRETGGKVEILLLRNEADERWQAMARPARRLRPGETLTLLDHDEGPAPFTVTVEQKHGDGTITVSLPESGKVLAAVGRVPLPHYITESLKEPERYQTVYARESGSVAAPTAGLHFTPELLEQLESDGLEIARVTLHVGPGTFQPVKVEDARDHSMHAERYQVDETALEQIRNAVRDGRRVIAVGTTSCRTLESVAGRLDEPGPLTGETDLYITPGYRFNVVSGLLTNFHLPRSTLLLLVSAFAGREPVLRGYAQAVERRYRFYSFGDAMLIV